MNIKKTNIEKQVEMRILIEGNKIITGSVNIAGFDGFSDYIEHNEESIKIHNGAIGGHKFNFMIIPKQKICFYEPIEESNSRPLQETYSIRVVTF